MMPRVAGERRPSPPLPGPPPNASCYVVSRGSGYGEPDDNAEDEKDQGQDEQRSEQRDQCVDGCGSDHRDRPSPGWRGRPVLGQDDRPECRLVVLDRCDSVIKREGGPHLWWPGDRGRVGGRPHTGEGV